MFYYLVNIVMNYCCFGKPKKRLLEEIKQDVKELTEQELHHLNNFIIRPLKGKSCC